MSLASRVTPTEIAKAYDRGKMDAEVGKNRKNPFTLALTREAYDRGWRETANLLMTRRLNSAAGF